MIDRLFILILQEQTSYGDLKWGIFRSFHNFESIGTPRIILLKNVKIIPLIFKLVEDFHSLILFKSHLSELCNFVVEQTLIMMFFNFRYSVQCLSLLLKYKRSFIQGFWDGNDWIFDNGTPLVYANWDTGYPVTKWGRYIKLVNGKWRTTIASMTRSVFCSYNP